MNISKILQRRIRQRLGDVDFAGDVNAVVAANVNEPSSTTKVSSQQTVVQRSGKKQRRPPITDVPGTNPPGTDQSPDEGERP